MSSFFRLLGGCPASAEPFAYVAGSYTIAVIDTATDRLAENAPNTLFGHLVFYDGDSGPGLRAIAVSPDGAHLYVGNAERNYLTVFDADWNVFVRNLFVCNQPTAIAFAPYGDDTFVTCFGSSALGVFDRQTNVIGAAIAVGRTQFAVAITPDVSTMVLTSPNLFGPSTLSILDLGTRTVSGTIATELSSRGVAVTPDGAFAYVTNQNSDSVSVVDLARGQLSDTFRVEGGPIAVAISPTGKHAYVANQLADTVAVIDTSTHDVTASIPVGTQPIAIALTRDGSKVYVVSKGQGSVAVIDAHSDTLLYTIEGVAGEASGIAIAPVDGPCVGDCDGERQVTVDELVTAVNVAVGRLSSDACRAADVDGDAEVTVDEIVQAVRMALFACPVPVVTPRPTLTPTPTATPLANRCGLVCDHRTCVGGCSDGSSRVGNCEIAGPTGCECVPFECPRSCSLTIDPVPSITDQSVITLTGSSYFVGYSSISVSVDGGATPLGALISYTQPFSIDVPLNSGLNQLVVRARAGSPPDCYSEFHFDVLATRLTGGVSTYRLAPAEGYFDRTGSRIECVPPEIGVPPAPLAPLSGSFDVVSIQPAPPNTGFAYTITVSRPR